MISVVIPTIKGREDHFGRCLAAYIHRSEAEIQVIVENDHPTVGHAWQAGAEKAKGDYIHLTCDDLEPQEGWDLAAIRAADMGFLPAPRVVNARTGALESRPAWGHEFEDGTDCGISVVPFCSRQQWEAIQPLAQVHYYSDDFFSDRGRQAGWPSVMVNKYCFLHHWAQHGRGAGMTESERMVRDQETYYRALQMVASGTWDKPWPEDGGR